MSAAQNRSAAEHVQCMTSTGARLHLEWSEGKPVWWISGHGWDEYIAPCLAAAILKHPMVRPVGDGLLPGEPGQSWEATDHAAAE